MAGNDAPRVHYEKGVGNGFFYVINLRSCENEAQILNRTGKNNILSVWQTVADERIVAVVGATDEIQMRCPDLQNALSALHLRVSITTLTKTLFLFQLRGLLSRKELTRRERQMGRSPIVYIPDAESLKAVRR